MVLSDEEKAMKSIWNTGLIFQERQFARLFIKALFLFCFAFLITTRGTCGTTSQNYKSAYDKSLKMRVYEYVDEWPTYNGETWYIGLAKDFNRQFVYKRHEHEAYQGRIIVELIIDKNGKMVYAHVLRQEETDFSRAVLDCLSTCTNWEAGKINGKTVNTKLVLPIWF